MVANKIELCSRDACTGCEACRSICPEDCIKMVLDREGFLYPEINEDKCIRCNRCRNVCPILTEMPSSFQRDEIPKTYACWINNEAIRRQSSSGGLFSAIAMSVLDEGGVVFGAAFDNNMHLHHVCVDDIAGLEKLRRSKYIQSEIGDSYKLVKGFLDQNRRVFFVGAPCQIAGLNKFLGQDYDNLVTADFICHGVPSPGVFSEYVKYLESIYACRLEDIIFRDKRKGWPISLFAIGRLYTGKEVMLTGRENGYFYGFLMNYFLRNCCYNCAFKKMPRCGDFTIADFPGIQREYPDEAHKGISCLLANSSTAKEYVELLRSKVRFFEEPFSKAREGNRNLYCSVLMPVERELFFNEFNKQPFAVLTKKYLIPPFKARIRAFVKCCLSLRAILFMQKCKYLCEKILKGF